MRITKKIVLLPTIAVTSFFLPFSGLAMPSAHAEEKHIESTDSFSIGGVTVSETRVTGSYEVNNGAATKINSHTCDVTQNYDPLATITSNKSDAYISDGNATFLCNVNVKRGMPTPWGHVDWSDRSATQGVVGNGDGKVIEQGWR